MIEIIVTAHFLPQAQGSKLKHAVASFQVRYSVLELLIYRRSDN